MYDEGNDTSLWDDTGSDVTDDGNETCYDDVPADAEITDDIDETVYMDPPVEDESRMPDLDEDTAGYDEEIAADSDLVEEIPEDLPEETPAEEPELEEEVPEEPELEESPAEEPELEEEVPEEPELEETPEESEAPDYFADTERATDVMTGFKPENWENMSVDDQKDAIEDLADYSFDALGIENKPGIEYYSNDDPNDFGYYDPKTHTINVNDANMGDALETADTIAHESRHSLQHMRAANPQNEQDELFRDSFDNYVDPDIDYQGYRDQLVEADAREYAQRFQDFIKGI